MLSLLAYYNVYVHDDDASNVYSPYLLVGKKINVLGYNMLEVVLLENMFSMKFL